MRNLIPSLPPRLLTPLYLLVLLLWGIGCIAIMPAFEGFDEQAYYSSLRQVADAGTIPVLGKTFIDRFYEGYQGPLPYSHDEPPFDKKLTYAKFFAHPDQLENYRAAYRVAPAPPFAPGQTLNWQAQHPPLYYIVMEPVMELVDSQPLVTQFFVLRLVSFLMALAGVALGLRAFATEAPSARLGFFLYPLILPMFFLEFTRIGSDSLCLLLIGLLAYLLSRWKESARNFKLSLAIGGTLAAGILTKAFFIPVTAALAIVFWQRYRLDRDRTTQSRRVLDLLSIFYLPVITGSLWGLYNLSHFGTLLGDIDTLTLLNRGGLSAGLAAHFSFHALGVGILSALVTYSWGGTWSLAYFPLPFRLPLLFFILWIFSDYIRRLKQKSMTDFMWLPALMLAFFGLGSLHHIILGLAIDGTGQTPGWYWHILMPFAAPVIGASLYVLGQRKRDRILIKALLIYAGLFQLASLWAQFSLFTGCAVKGDTTHYVFPDHAFCFDQIASLTNRLDVIGFPLLAALGFGGGLIGFITLILQASKAPALNQKI